MTATTYNISMLIGVLLVGAGVGLVNIPAAIASVGLLVIVLTAFTARMASAAQKH